MDFSDDEGFFCRAGHDEDEQMGFQGYESFQPHEDLQPPEEEMLRGPEEIGAPEEEMLQPVRD